ncbi:hypothetical protein ES703_118100 [subsurface metagenome]
MVEPHHQLADGCQPLFFHQGVLGIAQLLQSLLKELVLFLELGSEPELFDDQGELSSQPFKVGSVYRLIKAGFLVPQVEHPFQLLTRPQGDGDQGTEAACVLSTTHRR